MEMIQNQIQSRLYEMQDLKYREFHCKLMPTVEKERVIGIRIPNLRKLAKELGGTSQAEEFIKILPHQYYEENNLHAFLLEGIKDYEKCVDEVNAFLPYVDNWATCDSMSPKIFKRHLEKLQEQITVWIASKETYTIRFGLGMLMKFYLDEEFKVEYLEMAAQIKSEEYYVNMMIAWFFATALAKQYEETLPYIKEKKLSPWIHKKTIQKARESSRISKERKDELKLWK